MHSTTGKLHPTPPFDFAQSLRFLGHFTPAMEEIAIRQQSLMRAVRLNGQTLAFRIDANTPLDDSPHAAHLAYTLFSESEITSDQQAAAEDRITHWLSLKDDLLPFYALAASDPVFKPIVDQLYGYHQVKFLTPFEAGCWAILSSRNTFAAAATLKHRLTERYGSAITVNHEALPAFPEPEDILPADPGEVSALLRNEARGNYVWHIARALASVDEHWLREADYDEVYAFLRSVRGVGEWTASFILIRALGRMERLIAPEKRLLESTSDAYNRPLDKDSLLALAAPYGDYKAYWSHYLRAASS
jgi:DNA-3-methyladenine glycosylase II